MNMLVILGLNQEQKAGLAVEEVREMIVSKAKDNLNFKQQELGKELSVRLFRFAPLRIIDSKWKDHLYDMDRLKEGVGLRAYGQKDPLVEYKKEGYRTFMEMLDSINEETLRIVYRAQVKVVPPERESLPSRMAMVHQEATNMGLASSPRAGDLPESARPQSMLPRAGKKEPVKHDMPKVGRNDPCPCGSGKKYKHCHGRV